MFALYYQTYIMASLWMLVACFLFTVMAICAKMASPDIGTLSMVAYRGLFGIVLIAGWAMATGKSLGTRYPTAHVYRSIAGTLSLAMWLWSMTVLPFSTGYTLNNTSPLFLASIVSGIALYHRERIPLKLIAAVIIGFAGVLLVLRPDINANDWIAAGVGLGSGLLAAIAYFQIKQLSKLAEPEWRVVFYFSVCNVVFGIVGHWLFEPADVYTTETILYIVGAGLSATAAQLALTLSYGKGNLLVSSVFSFSGILFATLFGLWLFGESIPASSYLGFVLIIGAGVTASILTKAKKPK